MQNKLSQLFAQWEHNPPVISGTHAKGKLKDVFSIGQSLGLLIEEPSASSIDCPDCSRRCRVDYLRDASGTQQAFIHCRDCGLSRGSREQLQRWSIQTERVLESVFAGVTLSLAAKVAPFVWHVGKATWAGRSRQIWFARGFQREGCQAAVSLLRANSKAVVFTPTELGAGLWQEATGNLVIPLDLVTSLDSGTLMLDVDDIRAANPGKSEEELRPLLRSYKSPLNPPPGPPTDANGDFIPYVDWTQEIHRQYSGVIHPQRDADQVSTILKNSTHREGDNG